VELHDAILPKISTCLAMEDCILVGGLGGQLMAVPAGQSRAKWFLMVSHDTDNIVTHISQHANKTSCLVSSNDSIVRQYSLQGLRLQQSFCLDWSINSVMMSPDGGAICVVGDSSEAVLLDPRAAGKEIGRLKGHLDFSFCCAWSSDGRWLATGNQDHTARIYDTRYISNHGDSAYKVLRGEMAAIRSLLFSPDSTSLAMMEADDFVHLYDVGMDFTDRQTVDFFGETGGISFAPDGEHFYIGISGMERGGIFEYRREHSCIYNRFRSILL